MRKTKVYIYTRVSTAMQIDGYSLDAQKSRMKAFCEYNDYEIKGYLEYFNSLPDLTQENIDEQIRGHKEFIKKTNNPDLIKPMVCALI